MIESLATSYTSLKQAELQQAVGTAVLGKALDAMERQGAEMVALPAEAVAAPSTAPLPEYAGGALDVLA